MLHFVPSMLGVFLAELERDECNGLKQVLCSGEALKPSQVALFMEKLPNAALHNLYGPTEAAIDVTYWSLNQAEPAPRVVPIGKPVANTSIYILNDRNGLVPLGGMGEIHIGGVQVARGYLNRPELTAEKFVPDPFNPGMKMYRTGDLGRWMPDGNIEYFGRIDSQVKISGFRIELGEIESVLEQSEWIKEAVVVAKEDREKNLRLVGYIVPNNGIFNRDQISHYLHAKLPAHMVPSIWVELESLPLSLNGKINRKALPDPDINGLLVNNYVAPENETEIVLAALWQQLLGVERIGVNDNFFALGGHSLMVIKMVSLIKKRFNLLVPVPVIFKFPTIRELAGYIEWETNAIYPEEDGDGEANTVEIINL
jgi:acyl-coenzyme A synthetase/AMP-(fatty) acid ligase/acyl carrier protein